MSVDIAGLTKSYGGPAVVRDLRVHFPAGQISVLLGPSGCGKTTTLRCVAGLEEPQAGRIAIDGQIVFSSEDGVSLPPERRNLGMVFQSYAIWPHMSVAENIALPLKARGIKGGTATARVDELLKLVGLNGMGERSATRLSGGQQQRVAIARCLAGDPRLILLDEPLSNLDAKLRVEMRNELRDLQRRLGRTMVFVTHDQEEAMSLADRIFLFRDGLIEQEGTPQELYMRPRSRYVAEFLGKANILDAILRRRGDGIDFVTKVGGHRFAPATGQENLPPDATLHCMVRPECWQIAPPGEEGLPGRISKLSFIGDRLEVSVDTPVGPQMVVCWGHEELRCDAEVSLVAGRGTLHLLA